MPEALTAVCLSVSEVQNCVSGLISPLISKCTIHEFIQGGTHVCQVPHSQAALLILYSPTSPIFLLTLLNSTFYLISWVEHRGYSLTLCFATHGLSEESAYLQSLGLLPRLISHQEQFGDRI